MDPDFLKQLKNSIGISAVIEKKVRLKRSGHCFTGLCPFHDEKTPSFTVDDNKQFYHCFGCGAHGDVFNFVEKLDGVNFVEAVKIVASYAGVSVPVVKKINKEEYDIGQKINHINQISAEWFYSNLLSSSKVISYLNKRNIGIKAIEKFFIGYSSMDSDGLIVSLLGKFKEQILLSSGLVNDNMICRFKNRIMFPIIDHNNIFLGFGARLIEERSGIAKYINTSDSPLFKKSKILYGINVAKNFIKKERTAYVVEGYMDVISMHEHGFENTVGCMGTALSEYSLRYLFGIANDVVLIMDGDSAGIAAAKRIAKDIAFSCITPGKIIKIVLLTTFKDPDDCLTKAGRNAMNDILSQAISLDQFVYDCLKLEIVGSKNSPEKLAMLKNELHKIVSCISDNSLRDEFKKIFNNKIFFEKTGSIKRKEESLIKMPNNDLKKIILFAIFKNYPEVFSDEELDGYIPYFHKIFSESVNYDSLENFFSRDLCSFEEFNIKSHVLHSIVYGGLSYSDVREYIRSWLLVVLCEEKEKQLLLIEKNNSLCEDDYEIHKKLISEIKEMREKIKIISCELADLE